MTDFAAQVRQQKIRSAVVGGSIVGFVLLVFGLVLWLTGWVSIQGDLQVALRGRGVEKLNEGAAVMLGVQEVGYVKKVEEDRGTVARLIIDREAAEKLPADMRLTVESLNDWMPGNAGVRVYVPKERTDAPLLADNSELQTSNLAYLPADIPPKFYILVLITVLLVGVALGSAAFVRQAAFLVMSLVLLAGALLVLYGWVNHQVTAPDPPFQSQPGEPEFISGPHGDVAWRRLDAMIQRGPSA